MSTAAVRKIAARACLPEAAAAGSLREADQALSRRKFMLAACGAGGLAAYGLHDTRLLRGYLADLHTATGEIRTSTLADGSRAPAPGRIRSRPPLGLAQAGFRR